MEKTYVYERRHFLRDVTLTGWFCVAIMVAAVVLAILGTLRVLMVLAAVVAGYTAWNTFVAHAYPGEVRISDEEISFVHNGRASTYRLDGIREFSVRELPGQRLSFVRIDGGGLTRGRYWVRCQWFSDGEELFRRLTELECRINPESLKARARRSSIEATEAEEKAAGRAARKGDRR